MVNRSSLYTVAPCLYIWLIMRDTAFALPGIVREDMMTVSPSCRARRLCSPEEMRVRAERASPCVPVARTIVFSRESSVMVSSLST